MVFVPLFVCQRRLAERWGLDLPAVPTQPRVLFPVQLKVLSLGRNINNIIDSNNIIIIIIIIICVVSYTLFGGFLAVSWTDLVQGPQRGKKGRRKMTRVIRKRRKKDRKHREGRKEGGK